MRQHLFILLVGIVCAAAAHKCPFQSLAHKDSSDGINNCPFTKFVLSKQPTGGNLSPCPLYQLYGKCPFSKFAKKAVAGDGKCVFIEYMKEIQPSGGSSSKCAFYELFSRCPVYQIGKSKLGALSKAGACPFYKFYGKCPFSQIKSKKLVNEEGKCVFVEYIKSKQATGGSVSKCPFYELFGKCPLFKVIKSKSRFAGDGQCVFVQVMRSLTGSGSGKCPFSKDSKMTSRHGLNLNKGEIKALKETWDTLKRRSDFAPKAILRYLKEKPDSQKIFPEFANVSLAELPNNRDFLLRSYTCFSSLNQIIAHIEKIGNAEKCPINLAALKGKYRKIDVQKFGSIFINGIREELGESFTGVARDAWTKAVQALNSYVGEPKVESGVSAKDYELLTNSWSLLRRRAGFGPKVFIRYFKEKPEAQKIFPELAGIAQADLPTNNDLLRRSHICFSSINTILPRLKDHSFATFYPELVRKIKGKYNINDLQRFETIFLNAAEEELGDDFTAEIRDAWRRIIKTVSRVVAKPRQQPFTADEFKVLVDSWSILKKSKNLGFRIFMRYIRAKPEAQKLFPEFANVPLAKLSGNEDFSLRVVTCFNSLNLAIPHLNDLDLFEKYPQIASIKGKYSEADLKKFKEIFLTAIREELASEFNNQIRDVWTKAINLLE